MTDLHTLALEQTADAVVVIDRQGTIRIWNQAAARLFEFSAAEAIGMSVDLIIPEHLREAHWRGFSHAMAAGKTRMGGVPTRTRALCKSGNKLFVQMSFAVVLDASGHSVGAVAMARRMDP
ncbi:MAG: PAS domain S-box protein [Paralcaligenes sp.]